MNTLTCNVRRATVPRAHVRRATVLLLATFGGACGIAADAPPEIVVDRTPCAHCGMLVSELTYAAAYRGPGQDARVFDDIGCLLDFTRDEPQADRARVWVHDFQAGGWIDGGSAVFVRSPALRTPMGGGLIAFRDPAAARHAAGQQGTTIASLSELLHSKSRGENHAPGRNH
jgi:copper chaperone NosL